MAKVTKIEFPGADSAPRRASRMVGHATVAGMKHAKRTGDHILIHYDDGTTSQHTLGNHSDVGDSFVVELPEGVEP